MVCTYTGRNYIRLEDCTLQSPCCNALIQIRCTSLNEIFYNVLNVGYRWRLNSGEVVPTNMKRLCAFAVSHIITPHRTE